MSRVSPFGNFLIKIYALPRPAEEETYAGGRGVVFPSLAFKRWRVWLPAFLTALFSLGAITALLVAQTFFMPQISAQVKAANAQAAASAQAAQANSPRGSASGSSSGAQGKGLLGAINSAKASAPSGGSGSGSGSGGSGRGGNPPVQLPNPDNFRIPMLGFAILYLLACAKIFYSWHANTVNYLMYEYHFDALGLHIRKGMGIVREITISYRNIQNVSIRRGPLDLLLGLSKVMVETAGGGGGGQAAAGAGNAGAMAAMAPHSGLMEGIDRYVAEDIRSDLIERMRHFQGSGLGEFSEERKAKAASPGKGAPGPLSLSVDQVDLLRRTLSNLRLAAAALPAPIPAQAPAASPEAERGTPSPAPQAARAPDSEGSGPADF